MYRFSGIWYDIWFLQDTILIYAGNRVYIFIIFDSIYSELHVTSFNEYITVYRIRGGELLGKMLWFLWIGFNNIIIL